MLGLLSVCLTLLVASGHALALPVRTSRAILPPGPFPITKGKLVVFGDSYSDNGTGAWTITNHTWPADPAYGGHRFSNGPVWVEDLAALLHMELHDNAIGGATSNNSATQGFTGKGSAVAVPSMLDQVAAYLDSSATIQPHDIVVIMIGANDALFNGPPEPVPLAISNVVHQLSQRGAKKFLIGSYPDLADLPLRAFSTPAATQALQTFSDTLQQSLLDLWHELCDAHIEVGFVNTYGLSKDMMDHPAAYGFDPATIRKSCLVGAYAEAPRTLCDDPDRYIFWDEYHATRATHKLFARLAFKASGEMCGRAVSQDS